MRTIETTVYQYGELDDDAKAKARDWYREASAGDTFFAETPTEEFEALLKILGFDIKDRHGRSTIEWSGFSSQGDGAAFGGNWYANDMQSAKITAWCADHPRKYVRDGATHTCAHNARWHEAIAPIIALRKEYPHASGTIEVRRNFMRLESFDSGEEYTEDKPFHDAAEVLIECARGLADAFYRTLEAEYEYQNSDEAVAETIAANEYEFTETGDRA